MLQQATDPQQNPVALAGADRAPEDAPLCDDLDELAQADRQGFILPPHVPKDDFLADVNATLEWAAEVRGELGCAGRVEALGGTFTSGQLVPSDVLEGCFEPVARLYGINPLWVPAFFADRYLPWYIGGATFWDPSNGPLRVCLVLRSAFRLRERWLIYGRSEILSHEACHVARSMIAQQVFEESLAYALSGSSLRRAAGGVFRGRWESPSLMVASVVLMAGAALQLAGVAPWVTLAAAAPLVGTAGGLTARGVATARKLAAARRFLAPVFGDRTMAVLFRCTDAEIASLASAASDPHEWVAGRGDDLRWLLIGRRFGSPSGDEEEPAGQ